MADEFEVKQNTELGRHAVAIRDLKAGERIFDESPFAYGPKSESIPVCLGCLNPVDCTTLCSDCGWPLCSLDCSLLAVHKDNECVIFKESGQKFQPISNVTVPSSQLECVTPLRILRAMEKQTDKWKAEIEPMVTHVGLRKEKPIWEFDKINVVNYLRGACGLSRFSEDLIHMVCALLDVNAFEARTNQGNTIRCLYPKLAILSHACISNIVHSIDSGATDEILNDYKVTVRAATDIQKGEQLFSSYTYSLWPTLVRRKYLQETKYFECKCKRCSDATELGTHMSTLKCNKCDPGVILPTNPLDDSAEWKCSHCEFKTQSAAVRKVFETIQNEAEQLDMIGGAEGIEGREQMFRKYRSVLHPRNAYMTMLRVGLSQLYGRAEGYTLEELPDILLERKIELCTDLMAVLDIIEPGYSRLRGITFFELHAPMLILARHQFNYEAMNEEQFRQKLQEAIEILHKSVQILTLEPVNSPEGQLGLMAQQAYNALKENFETMVQTA